ncbi:MAG: hypothetical protein HC881_21805, partial [Leptolyngbyaceae cyanobacterium SL_7_1]|nr:hypothetical protein [Leptolyngbyaceae cyanobacterium SL_7_1]
YRTIWFNDVIATDTPEQTELLLSGVVIKHDDRLTVHNRIYRVIFDHDWIERTLEALTNTPIAL